MLFGFGKSIDFFDENHELEFVSIGRNSANGYEAAGNDPQIIVNLKTPIQSSWYVAEATIVGDRISGPKLYFDKGQGIHEADSVSLGFDLGNGRFRAFFYIDQSCFRLRFDPSEEAGSIDKLELALRRVRRHEILLELLPGIAELAAKDPYGFLKRLPAYSRRFFSRDLRYVAGAIGRQAAAGYQRWLDRFDYDPERHRDLVLDRIAAFPSQPLISIVTPTYNTDPALLEKLIASVRGQLYRNWELCIADDASSLPSVRAILERHAAADARIKVVFRERNGHISAASNSALALASGEIVTLADHDDELHPLALYHIAKASNETPDWRIIYSDEDKMDRAGRRFAPYFKGDFNRDLFYCHNMMTHLIVYRGDDLRQVGGFREGFEGSQDYDLALRILELVDDERRQIVHIPHALYHWRVIEGSIAMGGEQKSYAHERARKAINEHFARTGKKALSTEGVSGFMHRVVYPVDTDVLFSIVICTRDRVELLRTCVESIFERSTDKNYEIVIVDNGSVEPATFDYFDELRAKRPNVTIVRDDGEFNFSRLNNFGVENAGGNYICLLNNDTEVIVPDWIERMRMHLGREEVGAVGGKLLYGDGTIQHAGVVMGLGGLAAHVYAREPADTTNNIGKAQLTQQVMAVTGACLGTRKDTWTALGGLDAELFKVAYNDIDYCLKVWQAGLVVIYEPAVMLFHHESLSRGSDVVPETIERFRREQEAMSQKWGRWTKEDMFFNPNLDYGRTDFALSNNPRRRIID